MKLDPIVISLLDTDLYKFNMNQVIFHKHTDAEGAFKYLYDIPVTYLGFTNKDIE